MTPVNPDKGDAPTVYDRILVKESRLSSGDRERFDSFHRILVTLETGKFITYYQPIINVRHNRPVGYEALTRFMTEPYRPPDRWFADAAPTGLQTQLEIAAIHTALVALGHFPEDSYISLNVSPQTIMTGLLDTLLRDYPPERLVLEVSEHMHADDYPKIGMALEPLRNRGLRLAVDDAGAGYGGFQHMVKLKPDIIKLDRSLVSKFEVDPASIAVAAALARFAERTGAAIIAAGVETGTELEILRSLAVENMQGYLLGPPQPIPTVARQMKSA